jgi:hypothetical protein
MAFEDHYLDVLQNIEFAIISVYRQQPSLRDSVVLRAVEALIEHYRAEVRGQTPKPVTLPETETEIFARVKELCEMRLGRGGLGMAPGANVGEKAAIFEAVHGSAPDIAGKGIANPLAPLLAGALMLKHVNRDDLASRLRAAITQTLQVDNVRTVDLGGKVLTADFASAVIKRLTA